MAMIWIFILSLSPSNVKGHRDHIEVVWKQHHFLKWSVRSVEWWQVTTITPFSQIPKAIFFKTNLIIAMSAWLVKCSVLKNLSSTIVALVTEEGIAK